VSDITIATTPGPQRPGIFRRQRIWWGLHPLGQLLFLAIVFASLWLFAGNIAASMQRVGISPGFDFLWRSANFEIGEGSISFQAGDPYFNAILVGLLNTLKISVFGCILATLLGVTIGVAGLSGNLLLAKLVRWYVDIIRNTPLLLQLFFWISLAKAFPAPRQASAWFGAVYLTNRGVYLPTITADGIELGVLAAALVVLLAAYALTIRQLAKTRRLRITTICAGGLAVVAVVWLAFVLLGSSLTLQAPTLSGFNIRGGYNLTPEFAALLTGLTVKFSAAIAEIVRAGIQSVPRGQWEAAQSLGLHRGRTVWLVVLPQALRVAIPLTTSSYLDLIKDSSLAVAIGYPDLVSIVNTTANTTGQSLEALIILIGIYLSINLAVSFLMNRYNRRVAQRGATR
jgi:general L-amino acid transport system permease protein